MNVSRKGCAINIILIAILIFGSNYTYLYIIFYLNISYIFLRGIFKVLSYKGFFGEKC